jgi:cytidyltransferase-like protein
LISRNFFILVLVLISSILPPVWPLKFWYNRGMKVKNEEVRIMIFGTFDGIHKGHESFFKQAKKLAKNSYLIVSIARDINVKKIKKITPTHSEKKRKLLVEKTGLVDKVVLGGKGNHIPHIVKEAPKVIALGYDQQDYVNNLKKELKDKGIIVKIVRLSPWKAHIFKNHLLKKKSAI